MNLLTKYILKGYLKIFFLIEIFMIFIFLVIDYLNNLDKFVKSGFGALQGVFFIFLKIPFVIVHLTPVSIVVAAVIYYGLMNKNNEIIALCSSGISLKRIYLPVLVLSLFMSFSVFFISDSVMPYTASKLNYIELTKIKKRNIITEKKNNIWLKDNNRIIYIDYFNYEKKNIRNITINEFNDNNMLEKRTHADTAVYENKAWVLKNIFYADNIVKDFGHKIIHESEKKLNFNFTPDELEEAVKMPDEMSLKELYKYINQLNKKGYDAGRYIVDFHAKTAFPFVCLVMGVIGSIIGLHSSTGRKIPLGTGISLFLSLLYWSVYSFFISLGYGESLHPFIAAWTANLVFGSAGIAFFIFYEKKLIQSS
ncbi:MAG: LPS export ABC transporter permease LptG [Thermodesulfobacteriota bacterium]